MRTGTDGPKCRPAGNADLYLHVRVLIGIILGLSVTRLVSGIAGSHWGKSSNSSSASSRAG
jgi:hypothetical protein